MARPTANLLDLLELLQSRPITTGAEIAARLGVDRRTVRRYVAMLQELGVPVEGERGVAGGYRLRPGFRLPPLMFDDGEAAAIVLGLAAARRLGLGEEQHVDKALAKLRRVLPPLLRLRATALERSLGFIARAGDVPAVSSERLLALGDAVERGRRLAFGYSSHSGERSRREVSPHGLVPYGGRWYLVAFDHGREALRTFRVDRLEGVTTLARPALASEPGFDAATHVARSLARVPWRWEVEVLLKIPLDEARTRIAPTFAELSAEGEATRLEMRAESLDFAAAVLAGLRCDFEVRRPSELRGSVRALAQRLMRQVERSPG